jgi:hypothetical protein
MMSEVTTMALRELIASVLWLLLAACASVSAVGSLPSGDTRQWKTYRVEVGDQIVQFTIPLGESPDWPEFEIPKKIDLANPKLFNQMNQGPDLLSRFWDYRTSRYGKVEGTLRAIVIVWSSELEIRNEESLKDAEIGNDQLEKMKDVMEGRKRAPNEKRYEQAELGNRKGFLVHQRISDSYYLVPIDHHHYLSVYVGSSVARPGWREDAHAAVAAILQSIKIEPKQ